MFTSNVFTDGRPQSQTGDVFTLQTGDHKGRPSFLMRWQAVVTIPDLFIALVIKAAAERSAREEWLIVGLTGTCSGAI